MIDNQPVTQGNAEDEARRWIARMASAEMTAAELTQFKIWRAADPMHDRAFVEQRAIWRAAGRKPLPAQHFAWRRAGRRVSFWRLRRQPQIPRRVAAPAIAAALVAVLLLGPEMLLLARADHRAGVAVENIALPDGSQAVLNAGAAIAIAYDGDERRIELLRGDVWFNVAHGDSRPFRVAALGGVTQDIGTAFEIQRSDQAIEIAVTEGVVEVHGPQPRKSLRLVAAERARYGKGVELERLARADLSHIAAWRTGEILLESATPAEAIEAIRRYRSAPVYLMGQITEDRRISGVFRADRPDEAIEAIARMAGLSVHRIAGIVILRASA